MSKTGTVISWKKPYGFAETEDGEAVYIHTDEIDGGRLRVGLKVSFDIEAGKDDKPKGVNVTGEAVLAKDAELTEEQIAEDKERVKAQRKAQREKAKERNAENAKELDAVWESAQQLSKKHQVSLMKKLMKANGVQEAGEKRVDPTQKAGKGKSPQMFTRGEFLAFYGEKNGTAMWNQADGKKAKKEKKPKATKITKE